ncbi:MAG: hypothetical protein K8I00_12605 [Candidatus Omnitrophica bacterium]|nr:hypothetical protein [Candidatus Omnitrophota bacterium]
MKSKKFIVLALLLAVAACDYHYDTTKTINGHECTHNHRNGKDVYLVDGKDVAKAVYEQTCSEK